MILFSSNPNFDFCAQKTAYSLYIISPATKELRLGVMISLKPKKLFYMVVIWLYEECRIMPMRLL